MEAAHWTDLTTDPNSPVAIKFRRDRLRAVRHSPVPSRNDFFAGLAAGKRVLDVGCVDHLAAGSTIAPLHRRLAEVAAELVGVDVAEAGVATLRSEGFAVQVADVTQPGLVRHVGDGFDLVTAGEIIEHLLDVGVFFNNAREVLKPDGLLVLSTPNPHSLYLALLNLAGRPADNVDHVTYHWPSGLAEIADRCGFELVSIRGERRLHRKKQIPLYALGRVVSAAVTGANAECVTLNYVLRPRR